ncbi:MAG: 1-acyl-sn-glycerol-3-phosphate acyltransferase [Acidobacteriota bacterium]
MRSESPIARLLWGPVNALQLLYTFGWSAFWIAVALVTVVLTRSTRPTLTLARRIWAPGLLVGAGARLEVRGLERLAPYLAGRPALFVANHRSWIDIAALYRALPLELHFLAKRELAKVPFLGSYMRLMGMVLVDRADPRRAKATVGRAAELLAAGCKVISFPEGTRSRDGRLGRFKSGGFGAALEAGADVVPIAIVGAGEVLPPDGFRVRPGRIELLIGEPIAVEPFRPGNRAGLARRAEAEVAALLAGESPS